MASTTSSLTSGCRRAACSSSAWTRAISSATWAFSSATVSMVSLMLHPSFRASRSERDQAVLLRRTKIALGGEILQRTSELAARVGRLDDVVDQTTCGRDVRRRECVAIQLDELCPLSVRVVGAGDLLAEDHTRRTLGTHHGDLGGRPREHAVGTQVLAAHG